MTSIPFISDSFIENHTNYGQLITIINEGFISPNIKVPMRHHHDFSNPLEEKILLYY